MEGKKIIFSAKLLASEAPMVVTGRKSGPSGLSTSDRIPNNVDLDGDPRLQRALQSWHPGYLAWWKEMGPEGFQDNDVWLRTAVSVEPGGWAVWDYVRMPEYRWGIFLEPAEPGRRIGFGDVAEQEVWTTVPAEHRDRLLRLIYVQGDTEPASVEQQRLLGKTAPSLYDMRGLFQVNVEEGRHLWAMAYLALRFFGREGRAQAEALLTRRSGSQDKRRLLDAFNQPIENWLDYFMFTMFTDRDGKFQLAALAESGFDPLARTTSFMLTEEAHHLFIGETGVERVVIRSAELTKQTDGDPKRMGGIPLEMIQRYINLWFSLSIDLFGSEESSGNAAVYFAAGLKGRFQERKRFTEHTALNQVHSIDDVRDGRIMGTRDIPLRNAMNALLRDEYAAECQRKVDGWNRHIAAQGLSFRLRLPSIRFNRNVGIYRGIQTDPDGNVLPQADWESRREEFLPSATDRAYVQSLMVQVVEPGKMAGWVSAPTKGFHSKPPDFRFVQL